MMGSDKEFYEFALATEDDSKLSNFTREAINCAAFDTCCTGNVAGKQWTRIMLDSLSEADKKKVVGQIKCSVPFLFGNSGRLYAKEKYTIPVTFAGKKGSLTFHIIKSDIPLLMCKKAMKTLGVNLNILTDVITVFGIEMDLDCTSSGHYILPLLGEGEEPDVNWVLHVDLHSLGPEEQWKHLNKLHKQFGHFKRDKFILFMKDAGALYKGIEKQLDKILAGCEGCLLKNRNPDRPKVSLPMAREFNEKLAIDLKILSKTKEPIIHMIDMWSRLGKSVKLN